MKSDDRSKLTVERRKRAEEIELEMQNEERLRTQAETDERFRILLEEAPDPFFSFTSDGTFTYVNRALAQDVGKPVKEIIGKTIWDVFPKEEADKRFAALSRVVRTGNPEVVEVASQGPGGHRYHLVRITPVADTEGTVLSVICSSKDITEHKNTEKKQRCYERSLTTVLNASTETLSLVNPDGTIFVANETMARRLQTSVGDLIGRNIFELIPSEIARDRKIWVDKVVATGNSCTHIDRYDGITFETSMYPVVDTAGSVTQVAIFSRDVTDRVTAENDFSHSQHLLNATQRLTQAGGWEWNVLAQSMVWTDETYYIHGFSPEDKVAVSSELIQRSLACCLPEDRPIIAEAFQHCVESGTPYDLRFPFVAVDGRQLWVRTMANPIWKDGRIILVRGNIMDITQQVEQEHHLRIYHNIISSTTDAIAYLDSNYRYVLINDAYERFSGVNRERFLGLTVAEYLGETIFEKTVKPMFDRCLQGEVITYQQWFDYPALGRRYIDVSYFPYRNDDNRITGVIANTRDITDQVRIEEALRASEERFRFTFDYSPVGTAIVAPDFRFLRANNSLCRLVGYSEEELQSRTFADITHPEERERDVKQAQRLLSGEIDRFDVEKRYLCKHGGTVWAQVKITLVRDADQQPLFFLPIIQDITARKEAEIRIQQQADFNRRVLDSTPAHIAILDPQGMIIDINTPWNRFFMENNGSQAEEIGRGTSYFCSWATEYGDTTNAEQAFDGIRQVQRGERDSFTIDYPCHSPDEERWFSLRVFPLHGGDGQVLVSHTDISALKQTEKFLSAALAEKEVLLREVHHRVKNNLAAIISLLDMQRRFSEDRIGGDDLAELSGRIRTMSLIHEKLYQSGNMARIDFEQYLKSLISNLRTSFGVPNIQLHLEAKGVDIPLDLAVPCGMIINELMTNALKYAFPQGQPAPGNNLCRIEAGMQQKDGVFTLYVADNGVGLPPGFDWTTTKTLGMMLVRMLGCHQLSGEYAIDQQDGLRFTLTFSQQRGKKLSRPSCL